MVYLELFEKLEKSQVKYLVCGGLAVNIYGIPRMTVDIDLLLDFEKDNLIKFSEIMNELNYHALIPVAFDSLHDEKNRIELKIKKNLIAYSFLNHRTNEMHIDIIMNIPFEFQELWNKKVIRKYDNLELNLISVDDLIKMKEFSNRIQDQQDIIQLTKFFKK